MTNSLVVLEKHKLVTYESVIISFINFPEITFQTLIDLSPAPPPLIKISYLCGEKSSPLTAAL